MNKLLSSLSFYYHDTIDSDRFLHEFSRIFGTDVRVRKRSEKEENKDLLNYTCSSKKEASRRSLNIDVIQVCHNTNEATRGPRKIGAGYQRSREIPGAACGAAGCVSGEAVSADV